MYIFIFRFPSFFSHAAAFFFSIFWTRAYIERFCISMFSTSNLFMFGLSLLNVRSRNNINVNFLLYLCVTFCYRCSYSLFLASSGSFALVVVRSFIRDIKMCACRETRVYTVHTQKIITWKIENPFILVLSFNALLVNTSALPLCVHFLCPSLTHSFSLSLSLSPCTHCPLVSHTVHGIFFRYLYEN